MKRILFLIAIFCAFNANAQNYLISFAGTGASTTISNVKVENLTKNIILTLSGGDILRLTATTGVNSPEDNQSSELMIYPNPMIDNSIIEIFPPVKGYGIITVIDIMGRPVAQIQSYLEDSRQDFRLSGIKNGFYLINVRGDNYQFSGKLISNGESGTTIRIEKVNNVIQEVYERVKTPDSKGNQAIVDMAYSIGDRLKFTGISGNYSTVKTDIPASDKTLTFNFIPCTDGDNNNYPVVEIGSQVWMGENLKTTKYSDGSLIPLVSDGAAWTANYTPAYCWYNNDESICNDTYGALYKCHTFFQIKNGNKYVCPTGWHVPTDQEWITLFTYLGEGARIPSLMETGVIHWLSPNIDATNETGFTAIPGGLRLVDGNFAGLGSSSRWWTSSIGDPHPHDSTEFPTVGKSWGVSYNGTISTSETDMKEGISIRCLKDN